MSALLFMRDLFFTILLAIGMTLVGYTIYRYFIPFAPPAFSGDVRFVLGPPIYPASDSGATINPSPSSSHSIRNPS